MTAVASRARTKTIANLHPDEYARLRLLTLVGEGKSGAMQPKLDTLRQRGEEDAWATYVRNDEGEIIGWALTFTNHWSYSSGKVSWFYVHPDYRRQGVGEKLYRAVRRKFGIVRVVPWDNRSSSFFRKVGAV